MQHPCQRDDNHQERDASPVGHHGQRGVGPAVGKLDGIGDRAECVPDQALVEGNGGEQEENVPATAVDNVAERSGSAARNTRQENGTFLSFTVE